MIRTRFLTRHPDMLARRFTGRLYAGTSKGQRKRRISPSHGLSVIPCPLLRRLVKWERVSFRLESGRTAQSLRATCFSQSNATLTQFDSELS